MVEAKSNASYRRISGIIIAVVAAFVCYAAFMSLYTLAGDYEKRIVFGIGYIIAAILGLMYVIIRINTVFTTLIATDGNDVYMKNWVNDFLPYDVRGGISFLKAFIPARTKTTQIPVEDISAVCIGTKNFIRRNAQVSESFINSIKSLDKDKSDRKQIRNIEIFYVSTHDGEGYYMPIVKFGKKEINKLLKIIKTKNKEIEIKTGSKEYKTFKKETTEQ